jgi:hypothetical protein
VSRSPAAAALLVALAWPAAAGATDYGGGTAPDSVARANRQLTLIAFRTFDDGSARVGVKVAAGCGLGRAGKAVRVAADGTFSFAATVRRRVPGSPGVRQTSRISLSGRIAGAAASGTVTARLTFRRGGRVVERCNSGARPWQARAAAAEPVAAPPQPGGAYHGLTGQRSRPYPLVLRVNANATRVATAVFEYRQRCRRRPFEWENITPGARLRPDGTFSLRERFTFRWEEGRERYRVKVDGRFTPAGVNGTLSVSSVLRSRSGRVLDRCRTGRVTFAAAL